MDLREAVELAQRALDETTPGFVASQSHEDAWVDAGRFLIGYSASDGGPVDGGLALVVHRASGEVEFVANPPWEPDPFEQMRQATAED